MKIDVYDTYSTSKSGDQIHFDVLVEEGVSQKTAFEYAKKFLREIGEDENSLQQSRCNFCHTSQANPEIQRNVRDQGHFILQMEGCPNPL